MAAAIHPRRKPLIECSWLQLARSTHIKIAVSPKSEVEDIGIADQNNHVAVLVAEGVCQKSLNLRDNCAANHHRNQNARALAGELTESFNR